MNAIQGKINEVFMLGVQKIESDGEANDEMNDEEEQIKVLISIENEGASEN